jgi:hypothetical protein
MLNSGLTKQNYSGSVNLWLREDLMEQDCGYPPIKMLALLIGVFQSLI